MFCTSGVASLAGEDAVDIKKVFHHIKMSTGAINLVAIITKAIDTPSISYQSLR